MSLPSGAKSLNAITPSSVYYLNGTSSAPSSTGTFSGSDYQRPLALPLSNYTLNPVNPELIITVENAVPNTSNGVPVIFNNFPNIVSTDRDITIGDVSTTIDVSFITEGAGYLNAFGYYFYYLDSNNNPVRLTNADSNTDSSGGYYFPTIVFPNASLSRSGGSMTPGATRRLRGNQADGSFRNIKVGFFLISNGWSTSSNGHLTTGVGWVMHTTDRFNSNYNSSFVNAGAHALQSGTADGTVDGSASDYRRGIQTALLFRNSDNSWILSFEDISRPNGDSDYNDLVVMIKTSPNPSSAAIARFTSAIPGETIVYEGLADADGLFLWLDVNKVCSGVQNLHFTRTTTFKTNSITYPQDGGIVTTSPKDYILGLIQNLNWNYNHQITAQTSNTITQSFMFTANDVASNVVNGYAKLYLLSRAYNVDNNVKVTTYETNYQILLDYQSVYVDLWNSSSGHAKYVDHEDFHFKCDSIDNTDLTVTGTNFHKVTEVLLAWGDPYVQNVDGHVIKLPDVPGRYTLLKNSLINIEADTNTSPDTENLPDFRGTTFFKKIFIDLMNKGRFEIDLNNMNFKSEGNAKYSIDLDKSIFKSLTDTVLLQAINEDPKLKTVNVVIENVKVSFIKLPSSIYVQNIVLFDTDSIKAYATNDAEGLMVGK